MLRNDEVRALIESMCQARTQTGFFCKRRQARHGYCWQHATRKVTEGATNNPVSDGPGASLRGSEVKR